MKKITFIAFAMFAVLLCGCKKDKPAPESYEGVLLTNQTFTTTSVPSSATKSFSIYLPKDWENAKDSRQTYPVLYLLAGAGSDVNAWINKGGLKETTDQFIDEGRCPELIVVVPNNDLGYYVNNLKLLYNYKGYLDDLVAYVRKTYPVKSGAKNVAIAGVAEGGYSALYHALTHDFDYYGLAYSISGKVDGYITAGTNYPTTPKISDVIKESTKETFPVIYLECGELEDNWKENALLHSELVNENIAHEWIRHETTNANWTFWAECYKNVLDAVAKNVK